MLSSFLLCLQIREEIEQYGIKIYQFPDCDSDEDEEFKQQDAELKVRPVRLCCLCLMDFLQVDIVPLHKTFFALTAMQKIE